MIPPGVLSVPPVRFELLAAPRSWLEWNPQLLINSRWLVGILLVGAALIALFNRWRQRDGDECLTASDQLAHFRSLYERGEISQEEFDQLRGLLGGRMRRAVDGAKPASPPPA